MKLSVTNCFLIPAGGKYVLIDTGYEWEWASFQSGLKECEVAMADISHLILTHHHDDHAGLLNMVVEQNPAIRIVMSALAKGLLAKGKNDHERGGGYVNRRVNALLRLKAAFDKKWTHTFPPYIARSSDILVENEITLKEIGIDLKGRTLHTPGHSADSISILIDNGDAFIGDAAANFLQFAGTKYCIIYLEDLDQYYESWKAIISGGTRKLYPAHGKPFEVRKLEKYIYKNKARNMVRLS
jgi:glyoxylase-like metal-dependent hydrolase (beta-lactamase superfamily II)